MGRIKSAPERSAGGDEELDKQRGFVNLALEFLPIHDTDWGARICTEGRDVFATPNGDQADTKVRAPKTTRERSRNLPACKAAQKHAIVESDSDGDRNEPDNEDEYDNIIVASAPARSKSLPARKAAQKAAIVESDSDGDEAEAAEVEDEYDNIIVASAPAPAPAPSAPRPSSSRAGTSAGSGAKRPRIPWKDNNNEMMLGLKVVMEEFVKDKGHVAISQIFANTFQEQLAIAGFTEPPKYTTLNQHWKLGSRWEASKDATERWDAVDRMSAAEYKAMRARIVAANP